MQDNQCGVILKDKDPQIVLQNLYRLAYGLNFKSNTLVFPFTTTTFRHISMISPHPQVLSIIEKFLICYYTKMILAYLSKHSQFFTRSTEEWSSFLTRHKKSLLAEIKKSQERFFTFAIQNVGHRSSSVSSFFFFVFVQLLSSPFDIQV